MAGKYDYSEKTYESIKAASRESSARKSAEEREIAGTCPECKDVEIRDRIKTDLKFALETLFPKRFRKAWGPSHLGFISDIQRAIDHGEQLVRAEPRGNGKTSILIASAIVALVTGKHPFVGLVGATAGAAKELLEQITTEFETNEELLSYFPELIWPIRRLEGIHQRKLLWNGELIHQNWRKDRIILPSTPGALGASAIIQTAGLLGRIRGFLFARPGGETIRPTLVLVDDPQTDESAVSVKQNEKRENVICSTIPGLAGPGERVSVLAAVTVKAPDDVAARMLDRQKHPEWHGKKTALLTSIPKNADLWNQYAELLRDCQRRDEPIDRATEFYRSNREEMDAGGEASWPERYTDGEISGIQFGMNLKITNPSMFASEYQNCPLVLEEFTQQTDADNVVLRLSGREQGAIPVDVETLTAGIDVQKNYLVYTCGGFASIGTPFIVDYGTFPDQKTLHFDRRSSTRTIEREFKDGDADSQLWAALEGLVALLMGKEFTREDKSRLSFKKICIDVRYKGQTIKRWIKASKHHGILQAAQGQAFSAGVAGINDREAKLGEISKHSFRLPALGNGQIVRTATFDSSDYISTVHDALTAPIGSPGALTLFNAQPFQHRNFVDQLCSEYSTMVEIKGRKKRVWLPKPNGGDNDFLDSTKLMFLAAYISGVEPAYLAKSVKRPAKPASRAPRYAAI